MISVIIINYNTYELTCQCIESIYSKNNRHDLEIILVDNASTECSSDRFLEKFPDIKLIQSDRNLGFAGGNNLGIKQANGEYILLLNSDTKLINNAIDLAINKLKGNSSIGVISVKLVYPDGQVQAISHSFPSIGKELYEMLRLQIFFSKKFTEGILGGFFFDHKKEKFVDWVWGTFFLTRKEIIGMLPGKKLPDSYFMYFEDVEWCYWIKKKLGYKILYFPDGEVIHYCGASNEGSAILKTMAIPNEYDFFKRNRGTIYAFLLFFIRAMKYLTLRQKGYKKRANVYLTFLFKRGNYKGV